MRFQIKKLLEGYDPAELIEQSMYCFGSDSSDDTAGEENAIAGELDRSDVVDVSNISNDDNYDAQFTANNLQDRGLNPSNFMSAENFAQTTQGGASDPYALDDGFYGSINQAVNNVAQNLPTIATSPVASVGRQSVPTYAQQQNLANMSFIPQGALDRNYNINYSPAVDLTFPERLTNMFSNAYFGENVYNPIPSSISVTEANNKNYSPVAFSPEFTNKEEEKSLADLSTNLATNNQAFSFPPNAPQVDILPDGLGNLPQSSGAGSAPVVMQTAPTFDNSDFNFANSKSAENLQNMANITGGAMPIVDNVVGALSGASGTLNALNQGFVPKFDKDGNIIDVRDFSFGSDQTEGYIGGQSPYLTNIYGNNADNTNMANNDSGNDAPQVVRPTQNPVSGQPVCPDGYRFDDDLQACRLDTTRPNNPNNPNPFPSGDAYYRATSLDNAPMNVPSGFDFDKANQDFVSQFAYRPANFTNQMNLTGFTPFRRS